MFVTFTRPNSEQTISINADRVAYVTASASNEGQTLVYFNKSEYVIVLGPVESIVNALQNAVR